MNSDTQPGWQPLALKCCKCLQRFRGWIPTNVQMAYAAVTIKATTCPQCGADANHILFDLEPPRIESWVEEDGYSGSLVPRRRAP